MGIICPLHHLPDWQANKQSSLARSQLLLAIGLCLCVCASVCPAFTAYISVTYGSDFHQTW